MIQINKIGYILNGDDKGSYIQILDDSLNTGGYLILISSKATFEDNYDDWVEDYSSLEDYFIESNWKIKYKDSYGDPKGYTDLNKEHPDYEYIKKLDEDK